MTHRRELLTLTGIAAVGLLTACEVSEFETTGPNFSQVVTVCETLDFNQFAHGDTVKTLSALGMTLSVQAVPWLAAERPGVLFIAQAYDTDNIDGPDNDLEWQGTLPECPGCSGQGRVLVLEDVRPGGFASHGDDRKGGEIILTGFTQPVFVQSWKAFDNEGLGAAAPEVPMSISVDGFVLSQSSGLGNGSVETVVSPAQVLFNNELRLTTGDGILTNGSGAFDDIVLCREEEIPGGEGCTPGYWKNHLDAWVATGFAPGQLVSTVFSVPGSLLDLNGDGASDTLLEALNYDGGSGVAGGARILLRAAVASLLNSANGGVGFDLSTADVISQVNAALASLSRSTMIGLGEDLDILNNQGCPLN